MKPNPKQPVLVDGWTQPHEGEAYLRDFVEHGMNVWPGEMSKADMQKWGIRQLRLGYGSTEGIPAWLARLKALGLDYGDYFVGIMDEPGGTTAEALKPFLDVAKAIRAADPKVRICFNPSEAAQVATFQVLAPYCDFWCPYSLHVFSPYFGNPEKKKIYLPQPWMWYTTPCLWDKTAREPGIRMRAVAAGALRGGGLLRAQLSVARPVGHGLRAHQRRLDHGRGALPPRPGRHHRLGTNPRGPANRRPGHAGARTPGREDLRRSDRPGDCSV